MQTRNESEQQLEEDTGETSSDDEIQVDDRSDETESSSPSESENTNESEMLPAVRFSESVNQLQTLDREKLQSTSLIDDSILHLHDLMKTVGNNVLTRAKNDNRSHIDPRMVISTCGVAEQLHNMLKLKLEYHKRMMDK